MSTLAHRHLPPQITDRLLAALLPDPVAAAARGLSRACEVCGQRLEAAERAQADFLASHPPERCARELLALAGRTRRRTILRLAPTAVAAAALVLVAMSRDLAPEDHPLALDTGGHLAIAAEGSTAGKQAMAAGRPNGTEAIALEPATGTERATGTEPATALEPGTGTERATTTEPATGIEPATALERATTTERSAVVRTSVHVSPRDPSLSFSVYRAGAPGRLGSSGESLQPGDLLELHLQAGRFRAAHVFSVDAAGEARPLFDWSPSGGPPPTFTLDDSPGPQRIVVLFHELPDPIAQLQRLREAIARTYAGADERTTAAAPWRPADGHEIVTGSILIRKETPPQAAK